MRGEDEQIGSLFNYLSPEAMVPAEHPLRLIRSVVNAALDRLSPEFAKLYSPFGLASIPPEKLLRPLLLQAFYGLRSERQLMEQVGYNKLFRWFIGLSMDAAVWDVTVFTKNRDRLLEGDIARGLLLAVLADPAVKRLLSNEHFSVDGTMIEAWASMKSFQPKDGSGPLPSPGASRAGFSRPGSQQRHPCLKNRSGCEAVSQIVRPAGTAVLPWTCAYGNRNSLLVDAELTSASGWAERAPAKAMTETVAPAGGVTLGAELTPQPNYRPSHEYREKYGNT
jgi:transposase